MAAKYLYLFNIFLSAFLAYIGFQRDNHYILASCSLTFIISLYCFATSFRNSGFRQNTIKVQTEQGYDIKAKEGPKASVLTKTIINKSHGGRKISRKYWGVLDDDIEIPTDANTAHSTTTLQNNKNNLFNKCLSSGWALVLLLSFTLLSGGYIFSPSFLKNDIQSLLSKGSYTSKSSSSSQKARSSFSAQLQKQSTNQINQNQQPRVLKYSSDQLKKAYEEVKRERGAQQGANSLSSPSSSSSKSKFYYEVELDSGETIYADHVKMNDNTLVCTSNTGMVVSINSSKIKSLKFTKD